MDWEAQAVLDWVSQYRACAVDYIPNDVWNLLRTKSMPDSCNYASLRFHNGQAMGFVYGRYSNVLDLCRDMEIEAVILYEDLIAQFESDADSVAVDLEEVL